MASIAEGAPDQRPWLDHGRWPTPPRGRTGTSFARSGRALTRSCRWKARACIEIPVGPVHAGIIEPGHFRFTANGETVVRLEERLGYVHKGIETLMEGAAREGGPARRARLRVTAPLPTAIAFARAVEAATGSRGAAAGALAARA